MVQHTDKPNRRTPAEVVGRNTRADARFKPVRLPAVAAAMQAMKKPLPQRKPHDLPPILRRDPE